MQIEKYFLHNIFLGKSSINSGKYQASFLEYGNECRRIFAAIIKKRNGLLRKASKFLTTIII